MKRYHVTVSGILWNKKAVECFTASVNKRPWSLTPHAIRRIMEKFKEPVSIGQFIKALLLTAESAFEYKAEGGEIDRVGYKIPFDNARVLTLIVNKQKEIITVYPNNVNDCHDTLDESIYERGVK